MLLLTGGLGIICMATMALQMLESAFQLRVVPVKETIKQPLTATMKHPIHDRIPFVLLP
jgi:hypothetical protein